MSEEHSDCALIQGTKQTNIQLIQLQQLKMARDRENQINNACTNVNSVTRNQSYMLTYHDGCVPGSVFRDDHTVALLVPLRRLVLHVGDGDCQLHRGASVTPVSRYDVPCDVGSLWATGTVRTVIC